MALLTRTDLTFYGIVQSSEFTISSIGLKVVNALGRAGEMAYLHLLRLPDGTQDISNCYKAGTSCYFPRNG
jgi:hypothetical protein